MRALVYDRVISRMTAGWYRAVLQRLPAASHLLDVGMGTGRALIANRELVIEKDLTVTGVDIDRAYVAACSAALREAGLADRVEARVQSVYDHQGGPYAAVYFSASFMLMPDPQAALRHVIGLLAPGGRVYFTQTFEHRRSKLVERVKPLLQVVTTIDFGQVTYEDDFLDTLERAGLELLEMETLHAGRMRSAKLAVGRPSG